MLSILICSLILFIWVILLQNKNNKLSNEIVALREQNDKLKRGELP